MPAHSSRVSVCRRSLLGTAIFAVLTLPSPHSFAADKPKGEQIYRRQCVACHGANGEGSDEKYPHPLAGDKTVEQLSRFIARKMPKDAPKKCSPEEATQVAAYIYEAFYSKAAQARNKPPRIELSRLTVRQYRHAVADLIGTFRAPLKWNDERGLRGEYFSSYRFRGRRGASSVAINRIDPEVRFDFGVTSPDPKKIDVHRFSIRWNGSLLAPDTGDYEFIVRTEHAARLWINDTVKPLIDAGVKSGNDTEYRASIFLLGGRAYPLRLEFTKGRQGDPDSKNKKYTPPPVKASMVLAWKRPQQTEEVVPQRNLSPNAAPNTFVVTTPFPPDDRSTGYERGSSISKEWEQATTTAAIETADYVAGHLRELSGVADDAADRKSRLRDFCRRFAERAFRRPLTPEQERLYINRPFGSTGDMETAVKRVVLFVLKSPRFLYREIDGGRDGYDIASRLSFGLWDSLPDAELLKAAAAGKLGSREELLKQAKRMVADPRTHGKLRAFFLQWLKIEHVPDLSKDPKLYAGFDRAMASDLRTSLDLFLEDVLWSASSDFRQLLLADYLYLNGRLGRFYGAELPTDAPFRKVAGKSGERAGVLTHPYLLATFAYTATSSPIHRGVFLARNVLGQTLRPPPEAFTPLAAELHPNLTTRERVALQTKPKSCQSCHDMINPLGFTLEHFDAAGRFRAQEKGRAIDATGGYQTRRGESVKFSGVRDLAKFLANSEETHEAFVQHLFHYFVKQPIRAFGPRQLSELRQSFARNQYNVRELMVQTVAASALPRRESISDASPKRLSSREN